MARKRRQAPTRQAGESEEEPGNENEAPPENEAQHGDSGAAKPSARAQEIVDMLEQEVNARVKQFMDMADDAVYAIRNELKIQLLKLPKKVRQMPLAEFQASYGGDVNAALVDNIRQRLSATAAGGSSDETAARPSRLAAADAALPAAAPAGAATVARTTRRRGGTTSFTEPQPAAEDAAAPAALRGAARAKAAATPGAGAGTAAAVERIPRHGEVFYSANGSPLGVFEQQPGRPGVMATPMVPGGVLPTPLVAGGGAAGAVTIVRRGAASRGARTKQPETALVITTKDGRQVTVDEVVGLKGVPAAQRKEIEEHLQALQRLTATALKK